MRKPLLSEDFITHGIIIINSLPLISSAIPNNRQPSPPLAKALTLFSQLFFTPN